ncbi:helix-turn-helix transcriptional regulator [Nitrosospira multiformis]|nr:AlpA family phage regulatory protein [Nitrosospira multiformis]
MTVKRKSVKRNLDRKPKVREAMGWGNSTLYDRIGNGLFVPPVKIGPRASAWPSDEIALLQEAYIAEKSQEEIRALVTQLVAARKEAL